MSTLNNRTGLISGGRHSRKLLLKTALMTRCAPHATRHAPHLVCIVFFFICIAGNLGRGKNWKRGGRWEGERVEEKLFPLPIVSRAFYFSITAIFIGTPSGSLCRGERKKERKQLLRKKHDTLRSKTYSRPLISLFFTLVQLLSTVIVDKVLRVTYFFMYVIFLLCTFI